MVRQVHRAPAGETDMQKKASGWVDIATLVEVTGKSSLSLSSHCAIFHGFILEDEYSLSGILMLSSLTRKMKPKGKTTPRYCLFFNIRGKIL